MVVGRSQKGEGRDKTRDWYCVEVIKCLVTVFHSW